jgi:hypothetical protein
LERLITDGTIEWSDTEFNEVDPSTIDRELRNCFSPPDAEGIWYRSSRIFFPAEA